MPQHWVGRAVRSPRWLPAVTLAVVLAGGYVQPDQIVRAAALTGASSAGDGSAQLSLPWTPGETWRLTGGPHPEQLGKGRPWSALDFQPKDGSPGRVRAARAGRVTRPCPNMVEVHHKGGWTTQYYHLRHIPVHAGEWVKRGALLGWTSTRAGCGGQATGPHLHFSLLWHGSYINLRGNAIGGWVVREGDAPYLGCLVRNGTRRCAPHGLIPNGGFVGAQ